MKHGFYFPWTKAFLYRKNLRTRNVKKEIALSKGINVTNMLSDR